MKKNEEIPEGFVVVTRQIIKDNVYMGEEEKIVWGEKAKEQLSLPNDQRNPHWRNVKMKEVSKKEIPSYHEGTNHVPAVDSEEIQATQQVDIPRKRTRNV